MRINEVYEHFVDGCAMCTSLKWDECDTKIVIQALKKRIPKKPVLKLHTNRVPSEQEEYYCPACDEWLMWRYTLFKHCFNCGQAIDWSDI